jgi:hypothetical protein
MAKIVTASIDETTGDIEVELDGYRGKGCSAIQDVFGKALGTTTKRVKKRDYNEATVTTNLRTQGR